MLNRTVVSLASYRSFVVFSVTCSSVREGVRPMPRSYEAEAKSQDVFQPGLENRRNTMMTHAMLNRTNAEIKNPMVPIGSCGGVLKLTRMTISIVETSRSRTMQPYQANYFSKKGKVSAPC